MRKYDYRLELELNQFRKIAKESANLIDAQITIKRVGDVSVELSSYFFDRYPGDMKSALEQLKNSNYPAKNCLELTEIIANGKFGAVFSGSAQQILEKSVESTPENFIKQLRDQIFVLPDYTITTVEENEKALVNIFGEEIVEQIKVLGV